MPKRESSGLGVLLQNANLRWFCSPKYGAGEASSLQWIPVGELAEARMRIGLSEDGEWVRIEPASVAVFRDSGPLFLPVLAMRFNEIREILREGIQAMGIPEAIEETFPFEDVVLLGLESGSEYWVRLATDRVLKLLPSARIIESLVDSSERAPTQQLRHRAKKLAARMRRRLATEASGDPGVLPQV